MAGMTDKCQADATRPADTTSVPAFPASLCAQYLTTIGQKLGYQLDGKPCIAFLCPVNNSGVIIMPTPKTSEPYVRLLQEMNQIAQKKGCAAEFKAGDWHGEGYHFTSREHLVNWMKAAEQVGRHKNHLVSNYAARLKLPPEAVSYNGNCR